jgi:DNA-binding NarL/FixJ family response regulator
MRIAIADDAALFRDGLGMLLTSAGADVVISAKTGEELLARLTGCTPDAVIMDLRMPPTFSDEGLAAAARVHTRYPGVAVVLLSTYAEPEYAAQILQAIPEGVGYLLKDRVSNIDMLLDAVQRVRDGESVLDPQLVSRLLAAQRRSTVLSLLNDREREVLRHMAEGRSNAGIANLLHLSLKTVERNIASILLALHITEGGNDNRRVLAVLTWLRNS